LPIRLSTALVRRLGLLTPRLTAEGIEVAIREELKKPTGELTKADLEKVTNLDLSGRQLTEVPKSLEKLTQFKVRKT
jgi:Leucine-rich repeat (LRR) protein